MDVGVAAEPLSGVLFWLTVIASPSLKISGHHHSELRITTTLNPKP